MQKLKQFLYFYRLLGWEDKIAWPRILAYGIVGYSLAGQFSFGPILFNLLAIIGICMFTYSLNDFYDYKLDKEKNYIGHIIKKRKLPERCALVLCLLPLILCSLLFLINSNVAIILAIILLAITIPYNIPPFRLKRYWGWIYSPISAAIGFLQAYFVLGQYNLSIILLTIIVLLFHFYAEMIHVLKESRKGHIKDKAFKALNILPFISLVVAIIFSFYNPIFSITVIFSIGRLIALRKINIQTNFKKIHSDILTPIYASYEYIVYAGIGVLGLFNNH